MVTVAIVQARCGSARLPGKSLMKISGRPMIQHVLERTAAVLGVDEVVFVTSVNERDAPLADLATALGYRVYRGDEHDVLSRFAHVVTALRPDAVMRVTGDCPFTAPDVCQRVLERARVEPWRDYVSNDTLVSGFPDGMDCEVFSAAALLEAHLAARRHDDREHVTPWIRRHNETLTLFSSEDHSQTKLSVDCEEDLARARRVAGYLPPRAWSYAATLLAVAASLE